MTISETVLLDLTWKPLFFLANRDQLKRIKLAKQLNWEGLLLACQTAGVKYAPRFSGVHDLAFVAAATQEYGLALLAGKLNALPKRVACKQLARILYCLMRARRFELVHGTKESFVNGLMKELSREHADPKKILTSAFDPIVWRSSSKDLDGIRADLLAVQSFRQKCENDFRNAKSIILGETGLI